MRASSRIRCRTAAGLLLVGITGAPRMDAQDSTAADSTATKYRCAGVGIAHSTNGDACLTAWAYLRYLNQSGLHAQYTDAFGHTVPVQQRQDVQNNKLNLG